MFGYLTAYKEQLSEEDRETYQSFYCGLCRELSKHFGAKSQLILAYDLVFLAVLYAGLYEEEAERKKELCILKMKRVEKERAEALSYAADMNLLLSYNNYRDQAHDSFSKKALRAVRLLKKDYKRTCEKYPRQRDAVEKYMRDLQAWEKEPGDNPDEAANLTGKMLSEVFLWKEDEYAVYLRPMFFYLGKYIYLCDAFTDVFDDLKSGSYNPYKSAALRPDFSERAEEHLLSVMAGCTGAFEMLPILQYSEILRNILYAGVWMYFAKAKHEREAGASERK